MRIYNEKEGERGKYLKGMRREQREIGDGGRDADEAGYEKGKI